MGKGLVQWIILSVFVGLVPAILNLVVAGISGDAITRATILTVLFGRGELLMVSVGLAAGAIGDLLRISSDLLGLRSAAVAACFLVSIAATGTYGSVLFAQAIDFQLAGKWLAVVSLIPYGFSVVVSGVTTAVVRK